MESYKVSAKKAHVFRYVLSMTLLIPLLIVGSELLYGKPIDDLMHLESLIVMAVSGFSVSLIFAFFFRPRFTLTHKGIIKPGFNNYGYNKLIPWSKIRECKIVHRKGFRLLIITIEYPQNFFSRNGSKAIEITDINLFVSFSGLCDEEMFELISQFRGGS